MICWPLVKYVIVASIRDRLIVALCLALAVGASIAIFLGGAAATESDQFAVVFAAGGLRLVAVLGLVLFVTFHIRRSFDTKDVEFLLSRPISRVSFLLSHAMSFSLLAVFMGCVVSVLLMCMVPQLIGPGFFLWCTSFIGELIIMVNAALFFAMVLPSATSSALAVLGLYVLSRLMGQMLGIIDSETGSNVYNMLGYVFEFVSLIIPRLDLMAQTSWLVYGPDLISYGFILMQVVGYSLLVLMAAIVDLTRRQF